MVRGYIGGLFLLQTKLAFSKYFNASPKNKSKLANKETQKINQRSKIKVKTQSISKSKSISFVLTLQNERETKAQNFKRRL